ncbi:hypothetical protein [Phocaeicola barnesiae]|uniref:hypothetical protein n=1 Tax=Phocaeicola barnesiae TaxID=376804 RepID=UPI00037A214E|nr:hypothetical protein [Phocaeicola barnesiae]
MFFDENGILDLDEMIAQHDSFRKIMEDGIVTDDELKEQSDKVVSILQQMEEKYSPEQLAEVKELLVESGVLYAVYQHYAIQSIK